ncbi:MAG: molecular chaperone HtpG [Planctomycetes bacterium]|nr:molecular chaperone HtpG [Planctomycetota bacterium]
MAQTRSEHSFQAEVNQVLGIVINSLYSHREIFLRELLSNAADALDKLHYRSLTEHELLGDDRELEIRIEIDPEQRLLKISDNGIGMTRDELVENLGTIARSGSKRFVEAVKERGENATLDLIGQFGVGFYSSFLVADRVTVRSRSVDSDETWVWSSDAKTGFTVEPGEDRGRGTEIRLHLAEDQADYASDQRVRYLVRRYADYVGHPIRLAETQDSGEVDWETINEASALWRKPKAEIEDEEYDEFYKHVSHDWEAPLARTHFKIEGGTNFTGLLYVPRNPPFDLYDREHRRGVRLYVKRVFIMDDCEEILPVWLRFVRGIVDSDDLPLNVSRELLQEDRATRTIRKGVTKKVLDLLERIAKDQPEDYATLWSNYGVVLKEGIHYDEDFRDRLAALARFESSKSEEPTSLDAYLERMPEGQDEIYYAIGPSRNAVEGSPHIEALLKRDREVLFLTDPVDEWAVAAIPTYKDKKLVSAMRADLDLDRDESDEEKKQREEKAGGLEPLIGQMKEILADQVSEVRVSRRLTDSPVCLVVPEGGLHAHIERMLRAQQKGMPRQKRIFELNADHPVIAKLAGLAGDENRSAELSEWVFLLYDQACLAEGSPIADPPSFARRMAKMMGDALS